MEKYKNSQIVTEVCLSCDECREQCLYLKDALKEAGHKGPGNIAQRIVDGSLSESDGDFLSRCSLCGLCMETCPVDLDIPNMVREGRSRLMDMGMLLPESYRFLWIDHDDNFFSIFKEHYKTDDDVKPWKKEQCDILFFPGCTLSAEAPELAKAVLRWLDGHGEVAVLPMQCCGAPLTETGMVKRARAYHAMLCDKIVKTGATRLVTACPTCHAKLSEIGLPDSINLESIYDVMAEAGVRIPDGPEIFAVHDSCPDRQWSFGGSVREILGEHRIKEMAHHGRATLCCGSGGLVSQVSAETARARADRRLDELDETGAERCVTYCMACAHRLAAQDPQNRIRHILELVFGLPLDHKRYDHMIEDMWSGEKGDRYIDRIQQSVRLESL